MVNALVLVVTVNHCIAENTFTILNMLVSVCSKVVVLLMLLVHCLMLLLLFAGPILCVFDPCYIM